MPVYTVQAPDGKTYKIQADTPEAAKSGARDYVARQAAGSGGAGAAQGAIGAVANPTDPAAANKSRYDTALEKLRSTFYPDMPADQFHTLAQSNYSGLKPASLQDRVQSGTLLGLDDEMGSGIGAIGSQIKQWMGDKKAPGFVDAFKTLEDFAQSRKDATDTGTAGDLVELMGSMGSMGKAPKSGPYGPVPTSQGLPAAAAHGGGPENLGVNMLRNASLAAIPSGIAGFGNDQGDLTHRLASGVVGAGEGAAAGALLTGGARGINAALNRAAAPSGMSRVADDVLTRAMMGDNSLGPRGSAAIAAAGPDAMLADAGPNARRLLDTSIQRSGAGAARASSAVERRLVSSNARIGSALDSVMGQPEGVATGERNIREGSQAARGTSYDEAYAQPIDYSSDAGRQIETLMERVPRSAIDRANAQMRLDGHKSQTILAKVADDGSVTFQRMPDVRQLDYITRALNEEATAGEGSGKLGGQTALGNSMQKLSRAIRGAVKDAVPEYGVALETAAHPIAEREALRFGSTMLDSKVPRDVVAETVSGMSGPERAAALRGVRATIDEKVANVKRIASDPNVDARELRQVMADIGSSAAREKISTLVGDKAASDQLLGQLDEAMKALELRAGVSANSATMARLSAERSVDEHISGGVINAAKEGRPLDVGKRAVQAVTGATPQGRTAKADKVWAELADALTGPRGNAAQQLIKSLGKRRALQVGMVPMAVQPALQMRQDVPADTLRILQALAGNSAGGIAR